jgi:hypothetical protein
MNRILRNLLLAATFVFPVFSALSASAADVVHGTSIYTNICAPCHGPSALVNDGNVMYGANNVAIIQEQIVNTPRMQSLTYLTITDLTDVAAYLQSLVVVPQAGYWWNPVEGGRGFTFEQNPTSLNVLFSTFLYDTSGRSTWYSGGPAPVIGTTLTVPLATFSGGQTLTGAYKSATAGPSAGKAIILFSDSTHATMSWPGGTIPMQRYEFTPGGLASPPTAAQPQSGYWWNPAEGGRGYTIEVQNNVAYIASYMYDTAGNPVWYAAGPATLTGNNTFQGTWSSFTGGQTLFSTFHSPTGTSSAGSLTLQFTSATTATLTLPDGRQIPIERYNF